MARRPQFKPTRFDERKAPWRISIPARYSETGKRERYFFDTKQEAINFAEKQQTRIANFGTAGTGILSPSQTEQAVNAFALLQPHGISLNEVVQEWITRKAARESTVTFKTAGDDFKEHLEKKKIKGRPVSISYKKTVRQTLVRYAALDPLPLTEIDARLLVSASEKLTPSVKQMALSVLSSLFSWSMEAPRHWMKSNPAKDVPRDDTGSDEVLTFTETAAEKILVACPTYDLLEYHCLGFFAGIRPEELKRTEEKFINLPERVIVLPPKVTKTNKRRVIEITDTLAEWLEWLNAQRGIKHGLVVSSTNLRRRLRAMRDDAGVEWIQDGMRHTYASNWLAKYKDEHRLRDNLGHKSSDELWNSYHKAKTVKEAEAFWALTPSALAGKVVAFRAEVAA